MVRKAPRNITIEVTKSCNLRCKFCFYRSKTDPAEPSKRKIVSVLKEAKKLGIESVRFTGGEPLTRKDLPELLSIGREMGFYVILDTNATLLNYEKIRKIENSVDNVLVSLPAASEKMEKEITQREKLFSVRLKNIRELLISNIPNIRIGTIISKFLLENFKQYWRVVKFLGVKRWEFYRPMLSPETLSKFPEYDINENEILKVMRFCKWLQEKGVYAYIPNAVPMCISKDKKLSLLTLKGGQFDNGQERLVLDNKGYFKPTYYIDINLGKTIASAWNNPWLKKVREEKWLPKQCQKCKLRKICHGGSRFLAYQKHGDYFSPDPWMKIG